MKKIGTLFVAGVLLLSITACGGGENKKQTPTATKIAIENAEDESLETKGSVVEGLINDKKDFMFTVVTDNGESYGFTFDPEKDKPKGYDDIKDNDRVKVGYTGEVSEVDAFNGKILYIEKE